MNLEVDFALEPLGRDLITLVLLMLTSDWTPIMDTKTKGLRAIISLPRTISLLLRTSTSTMKMKMSFQTTAMSMSVLALKVVHLEKGTSELVKAIGDGGCCPWISSNTRFDSPSSSSSKTNI